MRRSVEVSVTGRVQGVSYRASAEREAARLGVAGWIRNRDDGSVTAHLEGEPAAVAEMLAWCRSGPAGARVERAEARDVPDEGLTGFEVRA